MGENPNTNTLGLDMYLSKKTYVQNWDHNEDKHNVIVQFNGKERKDIDKKRVTYIVEEVGYWRKANHIHKWFVDNVQDGVDECQEAYVSIDKLKELLETCKKVKNDPKLAPELLPSQRGFFFGGTDYDEYYMNAIDNTIKIIEEILREEPLWEQYRYSPSFYYQSSW
jgi:hypothetical protein